MYTEEELKISNKSYINKDFPVIYPEQIDLIKSMTNRWDPETSNESDPGIVLVKTNSFVADKLNYNIDKNVLENFMLSATQESSMRKLCDMMGYYMNYYIAPEVDITLMYTDVMDKGSIVFSALDTSFTSSEDDSISFILIENAELVRQNESVTKLALQGELRTLLINTSGESDASQELIQLVNIDDNHRVYFPETNVAQNGVFVTNFEKSAEDVLGKESSPWRLTKNLNYEKSNERCYKFGYDSSRALPYVEFPEDIADLIGNGLRIRYIITDGLDGNVKANMINRLSSSSVTNYDLNLNDAESDSANLYIRNLSGSINGRNPESINEAYNSFKKTIGTFNTLVTCRDYANAIYNMYDATGAYPVVSNIQVSDRRNDFNYSTKVLTYSDTGVRYDYVGGNITAYNLCCYPLAPIRAYSLQDYNNSFKAIELSNYIKDELEESRCISHDYKTLAGNDIYAFKNMLSLNARISTTYKVNNSERLEIISNVQNNLIKKFNSRNIDYGYEIPYDSLLGAITSADKRISSVSLDEPYLTTNVLTKESEYKLISSAGKDAYLNLLSKNILSGSVSLFNYDDNFNYEFGQFANDGEAMLFDEINYITTNASISLSTDVKYTLNPNEIIQLVAPNIVTKITYPCYVLFSLEGGMHDTDNAIANNTNYELSEGEKLYINYTDSNDVQHLVEYGRDSDGLYVTTDGIKEYKKFLIQPVKLNARIPGLYQVVDDYSYTGRSVTSVGGKNYYTLGAQESINIREVNEVVLNKRTPCYWITNTKGEDLDTTVIPFDANNEYMLKEGEYFFYSDSTLTSLVSVGSGTTLKLNNSAITFGACRKISIDEIINNGILALKDYWRYLSFSDSTKLTITENQILTLAEDSSITVTGTIPTLTNTLQPIGNNVTKIHWESNGESEDLDLFEGSSLNWRIMSRLDINVSKDSSQRLYAGQSIKVMKTDKTNYLELLGNSDDNIFFNLNLPANIYGGDDVDVSITTKIVDEGSVVEQTQCPMCLYDYQLLTDSGNRYVMPQRDSEGYSNISLDDIDDYLEYDLPNLGLSNHAMIFMLYFNAINAEDSGASLEITCSDATIAEYNKDETTTTLGVADDGMYVYIVNVTDNSPKIRFTKTGRIHGAFTISTLNVIATDSLNSELALESFAERTSEDADDLKDELLELLKDKNFYYNNKLDSNKKIDLNMNATPVIDMSSPYVFYDFNNFANRITISQIDFSTSTIDIAGSSRLMR